MINFSIIIPTYNRSKILKKSLKKIREIEYPVTHFEIIIVNNNSKDGTDTVIRNFSKDNPNIHLQYFFEPLQGHVFACNTAIKNCKFNHIVFIDDDISIKPDFLRQYSRSYQDHPNAFIIGGKIVATTYENTTFLNNLPSELRWVMGECNEGDVTSVLHYPQVVFSGNLSVHFSSSSEKNVPLFETQLGHKFKNILLYGQDYELCLRAHLEKREIIYEPKILVENIVESNRFQWRYVYRRCILAGMERKIIDKKLSRYALHQSHGFLLSEYINKFSACFKRKSSIFVVIADIHYDLGYFLFSHLLINKSSLSRFFNYVWGLIS